MVNVDADNGRPWPGRSQFTFFRAAAGKESRVWANKIRAIFLLLLYLITKVSKPEQLSFFVIINNCVLAIMLMGHCIAGPKMVVPSPPRGRWSHRSTSSTSGRRQTLNYILNFNNQHNNSLPPPTLPMYDSLCEKPLTSFIFKNIWQ